MAVVNLVFLGIDRLSAPMTSSSVTRNEKHHNTRHLARYSTWRTPEEIPVREALKITEEEKRASPLCDIIMPGFSQRLERAKDEWLYKNDSSLAWKEWACRNPEKAREICLEAEYFYGNGNILPKDWAPLLAKWDTTTRGDTLIDNGTYNP